MTCFREGVECCALSTWGWSRQRCTGKCVSPLQWGRSSWAMETAHQWSWICCWHYLGWNETHDKVVRHFHWLRGTCTWRGVCEQTASRQQRVGRKGKTQPQQTICLTVVKLIRPAVNRPDPTQKRFSYGHFWPLRPSCSPNRGGLVRC